MAVISDRHACAGRGISRAVMLAVAALLVLVPSVRPLHAAERSSILMRQGWDAQPPAPGLKAHRPVSIIIHHTGVRQNGRASFAAKLRNLQAYSQRELKWPDLPYHYYIDLQGMVAEGRDVRFAGDTNTNYATSGHIQVVLEGNFEVEKPNAAQLNALREIILWLSAQWNVPISRISTHNDHAQTACPGKNLAAVLPSVLAAVAEELDR